MNRLLLARRGGFGDNLKWLRDMKDFSDASVDHTIGSALEPLQSQVLNLGN